MTSRVQRFEELIAWQKAREFARQVYQFCRTESVRRDFALVNQLTRAAASAMSNIAEGIDRHGSKEFHRFLSIASGSCAEVRSHLYLALDAGYLDESEFQRLRSVAEESSRVIAGLRAAVERSVESK